MTIFTLTKTRLNPLPPPKKMDEKAVDFKKTGRYRQLKKEMGERGEEFFKWVKVRKETEKAYYLDADILQRLKTLGSQSACASP